MLLNRYFCLVLIFIIACKNPSPVQQELKSHLKETVSSNKSTETNKVPTEKYDYNLKKWKELSSLQGFTLELRYATDNNFTKEQIYDCGRCFLRPEIAHRLMLAQEYIKKERNWTFRLYDCYRPQTAQKKLWDIVPDPKYVTDPAKGSMHNRGAAVDLTIVDQDGRNLDMGTAYDHFGQEAHWSYKDLPVEVLNNRNYLKDLMERFGFKSISTEWWHYSLSGTGSPLSDWEWKCED
jgi:D-alanyl-D-alanine dipeptidase